MLQCDKRGYQFGKTPRFSRAVTCMKYGDRAYSRAPAWNHRLMQKA